MGRIKALLNINVKSVNKYLCKAILLSFSTRNQQSSLFAKYVEHQDVC